MLSRVKDTKYHENESKEFEDMLSKKEVYSYNYPTPNTDPMNKSAKDFN